MPDLRAPCTPPTGYYGSFGGGRGSVGVVTVTGSGGGGGGAGTLTGGGGAGGSGDARVAAAAVEATVERALETMGWVEGVEACGALRSWVGAVVWLGAAGSGRACAPPRCWPVGSRVGWLRLVWAARAWRTSTAAASGCAWTALWADAGAAVRLGPEMTWTLS